MKAYHITEYFNLDDIKNHGLRAGMPTKYEHVGYGIYVFFDIKYADIMQEYLGLGEADILGRTVVAEVDVDPSIMLMDEDSLIEYHDEVARALPNNIYQEYLSMIHEFGYDELPINDPEIATAKIKFIEQHKLRPNEKLNVGFGHWSILTARCYTNQLDTKNIFILFDSELYTEEEFANLNIEDGRY